MRTAVPQPVQMELVKQLCWLLALAEPHLLPRTFVHFVPLLLCVGVVCLSFSFACSSASHSPCRRPVVCLLVVSSPTGTAANSLASGCLCTIAHTKRHSEWHARSVAQPSNGLTPKKFRLWMQ